jgi:hypothetical protein
MKRFYFGSDEEGDEDDSESFEMPPSSGLIAMTPAESPFGNLLECSVRLCEKSVFWLFLPADKKLNMVKKVFEELVQMEKEYEGYADIRDEM